MGPRAVLDAEVRREIPSPNQNSNPDLPARSPALYTELSRLVIHLLTARIT
jgi:hypothetical protein